MRRRTIAVLCVLAVLAGLAAALESLRRPSVSAQAVPTEEAGKPLLVLYWEEGFQGRALEVTGSLHDLPVATDADGNEFNWNDEVRSLVVVSGTWRLFQNGRANTKLDDTPLAALDVGAKERATGWSTMLSATSAGPLEIPSEAAGGFYRDVSSIELVSEENLPDWASPLLRRK